MSGLSDRPETRLVLMGRIGAAHGIRGEVRLQSFCENPLDIAGYGPLVTREGRQFAIGRARVKGNVLIATFEGVTTRDDAQRLNGTELFAARSALGEIGDEDEFFVADLIGLEARNADGAIMGHVARIENYGAGDILEIDIDGGGSAMYAFTRENVPEIHVADGFIVLAPPDEIEVE